MEESCTRSLIKRVPYSVRDIKARAKKEGGKFDLSWDELRMQTTNATMNSLHRICLVGYALAVGYDDDNKQSLQAVVWCVCLVWAVLTEISLRASAVLWCGQGGGVYFVPHHLHPDALLRTSTYFNIIPVTHVLALVFSCILMLNDTFVVVVVVVVFCRALYFIMKASP